MHKEQNPYHKVTQVQANRNNQTIQYFVLSRMILESGGIIYGGYVRDIQSYLEKIKSQIYYDIFLDDDPVFFNDIDVLLTEKEFTTFIEILSNNAMYQINIYNNSNYVNAQEHLCESKTVEINVPFNRWKIDCAIVSNSKNKKIVLSMCDFDVNSLWMRYPKSSVRTANYRSAYNPQIEIKTNTKDTIEDIKKNIITKIAHSINYDTITFYRISKMLSKGYNIFYKDHVIKKMPIKLITSVGFYYCNHCKGAMKPIKNIGYGLESKLLKKMCFVCFNTNYLEFIKVFNARSKVILQLLFVEVNTFLRNQKFASISESEEEFEEENAYF